VLQNWFEPIDKNVKGVGDARELINKYRQVTRVNANIPGEGQGERTVLVQTDNPSAEVIRKYELMEEKSKGIPVRKIFLNPDKLKAAEILWYVVIVSKEKESSPYFKASFKDMLADMLTLMQFGAVPNKDGLEEEFSKIWGKPRNKLFSAAQAPAMAGAAPGGGAPGGAPAAGRANQSGGMPAGGLGAGAGGGI
jgi:hypothetical protein